MKRQIVIALVGLLLLPKAISAQEIVKEETVISQIAEMRLTATYNQSFKHHIGLSIEEEIRTRLGGTSPAAFTRSHTTIALDYAPLPYLRIATGYVLKLYGDKGWTDPNKYIRHRVFLNLTGQLKINQWTLSLRERLLIDCRSDEVNHYEENKADLSLRHRLQVSYSIPSKPIRLYTGVELLNTLNAPTEYLNRCGTKEYGQYLSRVRPETGMRWNINKRNSLSVAYRFDYRYKRGISILQGTGDVELQHQYAYHHLIILSYQFNN